MKLFRTYYPYARREIMATFRKYNADLFARMKRYQMGDWGEAASGHIHEEYFQQSYKRIYQKTGPDFALHFVRKYKKADPNAQENYWRYYFENYAKQKVGNRITLITNTTRDEYIRIVKQAVAKGIAEGWGEDRTGRLIQQMIGYSDVYRADRIARTEVNTAGNAGHFEGVNSLNMRAQKEWMTAADDRVRGLKPSDQFDHVMMDGVTIDFSEQFNVSGELLDYPMAPGGSAGNVINCRCSFNEIIEE